MQSCSPSACSKEAEMKKGAYGQTHREETTKKIKTLLRGITNLLYGSLNNFDFVKVGAFVSHHHTKANKVAKSQRPKARGKCSSECRSQVDNLVIFLCTVAIGKAV